MKLRQVSQNKPTERLEGSRPIRSSPEATTTSDTYLPLWQAPGARGFLTQSKGEVSDKPGDIYSFLLFCSFLVEFVEIGSAVQSTFTSTMEFHLTIIKSILNKMCMNFWLGHSVHSLVWTLASVYHRLVVDLFHGNFIIANLHYLK